MLGKLEGLTVLGLCFLGLWDCIGWGAGELGGLVGAALLTWLRLDSRT